MLAFLPRVPSPLVAKATGMGHYALPNLAVSLTWLTVGNSEADNESAVNEGGAFDSAKNHKRQRRKRQSVTAKREKSQTPKFV